MPRPAEELHKDADEVAEWRRTLHHKGRDILPADDKFTSLIAELSARLREHQERIESLEKALKAEVLRGCDKTSYKVLSKISAKNLATSSTGSSYDG